MRRGGSSRRFAGFGLGPIQMGLMLYEAAASGNFESYVVAEIDQDLVERVRRNGDAVSLNIARRDGIEHARLEGILAYNPGVSADRAALARAVRDADEMATAVPSVSLYEAGGDGSVAALLARNVDPEKHQVVYAAENHNSAARLLGEAVRSRLAPGAGSGDRLRSLDILDTVIGKMSGVVSGPDQIARLGLVPLTPDSAGAVLVEEFNRILVSRCRIREPGRGITVFEEKDDLLPYEEAKLFGHNAVHALLGYLAAERGCAVMSEIRGDPDLMKLGLEVLVEECGAALIRRYGAAGGVSGVDPLFTREGWRAYARDLLLRITNPHLHDSVARICRDPVRKLGYGDRIFGAMRMAMSQGIEPVRLARAAASAIRYALFAGVPLPRFSGDGVEPETDGSCLSAGGLDAARGLDAAGLRCLLQALWRVEESGDGFRERCLTLAEAGLRAGPGGIR